MVGDEPQAVEAGATVLAHRGNAADAAAATYFALAVTYPVAAGLGGGGICIVYNPQQKNGEEFDFLAREASGRGPYSIPGNVAGFALLQSTYGQLPWQRVVSPAESFAAAGFSISQALYARLSTNQDVIRLDAELAREFLDEAGHLKPTGAIVQAPALAQTLSQVRATAQMRFTRARLRARSPATRTRRAVISPLRSYPRIGRSEMRRCGS